MIVGVAFVSIIVLGVLFDWWESRNNQQMPWNRDKWHPKAGDVPWKK